MFYNALVCIKPVDVVKYNEYCIQTDSIVSDRRIIFENHPAINIDTRKTENMDIFFPHHENMPI